jgi:hypothetical protein
VRPDSLTILVTPDDIVFEEELPGPSEFTRPFPNRVALLGARGSCRLLELRHPNVLQYQPKKANFHSSGFPFAA